MHPFGSVQSVVVSLITNIKTYMEHAQLLGAFVTCSSGLADRSRRRQGRGLDRGLCPWLCASARGGLLAPRRGRRLVATPRLSWALRARASDLTKPLSSTSTCTTYDASFRPPNQYIRYVKLGTSDRVYVFYDCQYIHTQLLQNLRNNINGKHI